MSDSHDKDRVLTAEAISNHARSLSVGHLLDVASTDQDGLKAWFTGKLDFSPPVLNLTKEGYKLNGDSHPFVNDTGIDSAKSECVAKNVGQIFFARLVGNHIQIARWIGGLIIQSRWN